MHYRVGRDIIRLEAVRTPLLQPFSQSFVDESRLIIRIFHLAQPAFLDSTAFLQQALRPDAAGLFHREAGRGYGLESTQKYFKPVKKLVRSLLGLFLRLLVIDLQVRSRKSSIPYPGNQGLEISRGLDKSFIEEGIVIRG